MIDTLATYCDCGEDLAAGFYHWQGQFLCERCYQEREHERKDSVLLAYARAGIPSLEQLVDEFRHKYPYPQKTAKALFTGRCAQVTDALHGILLPIIKKNSRQSRGHWLAPAVNRQVPFQQHSWITVVHPETNNNIIIDPTHFVFTGDEPQISVHTRPEVLDCYDEAGIRVRESHSRPMEPRQGETKPNALSAKAQSTLADVFEPRSWNHWTINEMFVIANTNPQRLGNEAKPIFQEICKQGHSAFIPIDVRKLLLL